jgi:large subunit ribosomal protein L10
MREEKQLLLEQIQGNLDTSNALILTRYSGLTPDLSDNLRRMLSESGSSYFVVPKRVFIKAAANAGIKLEREQLQGNIGVVFAKEDIISPTKVVFKFSKENNGTLEVLSGIFEGNLRSAADVKAISELPLQDEMRAQLLGLFEAPMAQILSVMEALLTSVIYCLDNKAQATN